MCEGLIFLGRPAISTGHVCLYQPPGGLACHHVCSLIMAWLESLAPAVPSRACPCPPVRPSVDRAPLRLATEFERIAPDWTGV